MHRVRWLCQTSPAPQGLLRRQWLGKVNVEGFIFAYHYLISKIDQLLDFWTAFGHNLAVQAPKHTNGPSEVCY